MNKFSHNISNVKTSSTLAISKAKLTAVVGVRPPFSLRYWWRSPCQKDESFI